MNKDELVSYIQGLLDMNKTTEKLYGSLNVEFDSSIESELLKLINKALEKHRENLNGEIKYFNKKANEYATPKEKEGDDPIWNGPSEDLLPDDVDEGFIKHKQITKKQPQISNYGEFGAPKEDELYPELTMKQAEDLVGDLTLASYLKDDLAPQCFHEDEDGDDYYLSSKGNRYYLFKRVVTLKGDREQIMYTFGKKEWIKRNNYRLLKFYNIPYDKCVVESKSGYPFLKTEVKLNHEIKEKTPKWDL